MSTRWSRVALLAAFVVAASPVLVQPAEADAPDGYTSWQAKDQQHNQLAPVGAHSPTIDEVSLPFRNDPNHVVVEGHEGATQWSFSLDGDNDHPLEAGTTYVADAAHPFRSVSRPVFPGLVADSPNCTTLVGSFTMQELTIDADSRVLRFSATYSLGCMDANGDPNQGPDLDTTANSVATGSIAFHTSAPPPDAPEPRGGLPTGSVGGVWADYDIGDFRLHWADPVDVDWADTIVCGRPGLEPLSKPASWCLENAARTRGMDWAGTTAVSGWSVGLWPRYRDGHLGSRTVFTVRGSIVTLETDPSSASATTGLHLHGTLLDGPSRRPMGGRLVNVFLTRPWPDIADSPDGGSREEKLAARLRTDAHGNYGETFPLRPGWQYQARFDGNEVRIGNVAQLVPADGSSYIDLDAARAAGGRAKTMHLRAKVASAHRGDKVLFQRMVKRHWRKVAVRRPGKTGVAVLPTHIDRGAVATFRALLVPAGAGIRRASVPLRIRVG